MKRYCFILILLFIVSCQQNHQQQGHTRELLPDPEKYEHDNYNPQNITFLPDTSVNLFCLLSGQNIQNILGPNVLDKLNTKSLLPYLTILSKDKSQCLFMYIQQGEEGNKFSEFEVVYASRNDIKSGVQSNEMEFKTESGIKLGMTLGQLKSIKGEPELTFKKSNQLIYAYEIKNIQNSDFLRRYKMPQYYSDYTFINGYLEKYRFGFKYLNN